MKYKIVNINDIDIKLISNFYEKNTAKEKKYINKIKNKNRRIQTIIGRILLSDLLKKYYKIDYFDLKVNYTKNGKPYFQNLDIFFNISHSNDYVICAISNSEIGVDIEKITNLKKEFIDKYTSNEEKKFVFNNKNKINKNFFIIFSLKESYIKMYGNSVFDCINEINDFRFKNNKINIKNANYKIIDIYTNYIVTICWKK